MTVEEVEAQVEALARLNPAGLRAAYERRHGEPPRLRSPDMLRRLLAFDLQADTFGGIDSELREALRHARTSPRRGQKGPPAGATIVREWRGTRHEVTVVDAGFVHGGITYKTLSEVARAITGTRWSGPRFFGLDQTKAGQG